ncbi:IS256 family transposase [Lactobacillus phage CR28]|nr:IS256 family transposase [Lactobacillus phage CR28]
MKYLIKGVSEMLLDAVLHIFAELRKEKGKQQVAINGYMQTSWEVV